jgi:hypothetical protein
MANLGPASSMASVFGGAITDLGEAVPDRDLAGPQSLVLSSRRIRAVRKLTNTGFRYGTASTPSPILRAVDKRSG